MANQMYGKGRNKFGRGEIHWKASGDTIRAFLVDAALYTPSIDVHEFLSDVPVSARKGNAGGTARSNAPILTLLDPELGVLDANDITFTAVPVGSALEYIVLFKDDGVADASSPLVGLIDTATGLPVTPNGSNITVAWDNGANRVLKL
jgi:hypothetical protein